MSAGRPPAKLRSKPARSASFGRLRPMKTSGRRRFSFLPRSLMISLQAACGPWTDKAIGVVSKGDDPLHAQDVCPEGLDDFLDPWRKLAGIERLIGHQRQAGNVVVMFVFMEAREEVGFDFQYAVETEGVATQHIGQLDAAALRLTNRRNGIDGANSFARSVQLLRLDEIGLIQEDDIREGDLFLGFMGVVERTEQVLCVNDCSRWRRALCFANILVDEESLGDGGWIGEACGFDQNPVKSAASPHQAFDDADEVAAHATADATRCSFRKFLRPN